MKEGKGRKMAWESTEWACGHSGSMQLYGKRSGRDSRVAYEAGKRCLACWLINQWSEKMTPDITILEGGGSRPLLLRARDQDPGAEITKEEVMEHAETTK